MRQYLDKEAWKQELSKELYSLESSKETKEKNIFSSKFKCTLKQQLFANIAFINNYL